MMKVNCTHCKQEIKPYYSCPCQSRGRGLESYHDDKDFSCEVETRDKLFEELAAAVRKCIHPMEGYRGRCICQGRYGPCIYCQMTAILTKLDALGKEGG